MQDAEPNGVFAGQYKRNQGNDQAESDEAQAAVAVFLQGDFNIIFLTDQAAGQADQYDEDDGCQPSFPEPETPFVWNSVDAKKDIDVEHRVKKHH